MGAVRQLGTGRAVPGLDRAAAAFLASVANANTRKSHGAAVAVLLDRLGAGQAVSVLESEEAADAVAAMFTARWGRCAPATRAARYDGLRAAIAYWQAQGWLASDPLRRLARPRKPEALDRAWSRARVEELLTRRSLPIREKLLYTMLYETSARVSEVLALDVPDLDRPNRRAPVRRKGGDADWIVWQTRTATLLPRYLKGRTRGPLILTGRRARVELPAADLDPGSGHARLSYDTAEELFREHSYGGTLHQLRHSSLTHAAEAGMNTPMLKRKSGHRSLTSLGRYARPSVDALARWQDEHDPARRLPVPVIGAGAIGVEGQGLAQPAQFVGVEHHGGPPAARGAVVQVVVSLVPGGSLTVIQMSWPSMAAAARSRVTAGSAPRLWPGSRSSMSMPYHGSASWTAASPAVQVTARVRVPSARLAYSSNAVCGCTDSSSPSAYQSSPAASASRMMLCCRCREAPPVRTAVAAGWSQSPAAAAAAALSAAPARRLACWSRNIAV